MPVHPPKEKAKRKAKKDKLKKAVATKKKGK